MTHAWKDAEMNPPRYPLGTEVDVVCESGKIRRAILDSQPEYGWVCVRDLKGRAGSASVRVGTVRPIYKQSKLEV